MKHAITMFVAISALAVSSFAAPRAAVKCCCCENAAPACCCGDTCNCCER